jgi:hypothetical protein
MSALANKYGATFGGLTLAPQGMPGTGSSNGATVTGGLTSRLNSENPLLWLFGIGAVTLGLVAASTSLRVGPVRASVSAGKS